MNTVPEDVTQFVQSHLQSLQELRGQFDSVFALEKMLGSNGRYIWEAWAKDEIQRRLRMAQDGLNLFRSLAQQNGIDPESFINSLGGQPSFSDCEKAATKFNS
jgi:hypothetical protein